MGKATKPTMEQIRHFFRLMEEGLVSKVNFQQYLEGLSRPVEDKETKGVETPDKQYPCQTLAADLIPKGWTVVEDIPPSEFEVASLEFVSFLEGDESYIGGEKMRSRAVTLRGNLGLSDAKHLLAEQDAIPTEMRGKYIVLPGTVLRDPDGDLHVAYLDWDGGRWYLDFGWLDYDWRGHGRLARSK